ncbi:hypothetical protein MIC97_20515 [Aquamicrobium sp. NLF2-7]|uniref:hypothetical protein n=1 Tax=Aquamicrobium sp. NLF2-7 TaxID=2918753 RepID=UPI001EFBDD52|nr:hypothetical protein [Aquamicrobium sp. NLF2-7]MCG8273871.1 hypothetical protein [Aquamicrobium sp. NLF2-7]
MNMRVGSLVHSLVALGAVSVLAAFPARAQSPGTELVGAFTEELGTAARISAARVVVGVALRGPQSDRRPTVEALFPGDWASAACARWLTSDALYWAYGTYRLREGWKGGGVASIPYPTGKAEMVGALGAERMAVAITRGDCNTDSLEFVPALWNTAYVGNARELLVLVNSRGAEEVYVLSGPSIDVTCNALADGGTVGFDHVCLIPVRPQEGALNLEVNRIRRGNMDDPVDISVVGVGAP